MKAALKSGVARPRVENKREKQTLSFDPVMLRRLEALADRTGIPMSRIVERAMKMLLARAEKDLTVLFEED